MEKELEIHEVERKSGNIKQYQYLVHITPDQTYYSPLCNSQEELDAWFAKMFKEEEVVDSFHDRWGE